MAYNAYKIGRRGCGTSNLANEIGCRNFGCANPANEIGHCDYEMSDTAYEIGYRDYEMTNFSRLQAIYVRSDYYITLKSASTT